MTFMVIHLFQAFSKAIFYKCATGNKILTDL